MPRNNRDQNDQKPKRQDTPRSVPPKHRSSSTESRHRVSQSIQTTNNGAEDGDGNKHGFWRLAKNWGVRGTHSKSTTAMKKDIGSGDQDKNGNEESQGRLNPEDRKKSRTSNLFINRKEGGADNDETRPQDGKRKSSMGSSRRRRKQKSSRRTQDNQPNGEVKEEKPKENNESAKQNERPEKSAKDRKTDEVTRNKQTNDDTAMEKKATTNTSGAQAEKDPSAWRKERKGLTTEEKKKLHDVARKRHRDTYSEPDDGNSISKEIDATRYYRSSSDF